MENRCWSNINWSRKRSVLFFNCSIVFIFRNNRMTLIQL